MFNKIAIAATLAIASTAAMAADAPKFFVGAEYGTNKAKDSSDRESGAGIFGGYQFNEHFGIEGGYRRVAKDSGVVEGDIAYTAHVDQLAVSAVGTIPLSNGFSVYGRLGMNRMTIDGNAGNASVKDHANRGMYGVGVGYSFTPTVSARLELQKPMSDITSLNAGVVFKF